MKVGIIVIATGKYYMFIKDLVESFESFFIPDADKHYFILTDKSDPDIIGDNIHYIEHQKEEWPFVSLFRFKNVYQHREKFESVDYLFFSNANMKAVDIISEEILPKDNFEFAAVLHPGYYLDQARLFPYERNEWSNAYIPYGIGQYYFQGCFYGGKRENFLEMFKEISISVEDDLERNIIAIVHDESHLNKYLLDRNVLTLDPIYSYPEQIFFGESDYRDCASYVELAKKKPKMIQIDKRKLGGHDFLRQ
jgi:hypothetical protein